MAENEGRYKVLELHAHAPHGQLNESAVKDLMNRLATEGSRVVAATGRAVILERTADHD
jgi:hypothetical protein